MPPHLRASAERAPREPPPTDPDPDARGIIVVLYNAAWALFLSVACAAYLVATDKGAGYVRSMTNRDDVERAFLTGAMSFFVGWQWIVAVQGLSINAYRQQWLSAVDGEGVGLTFIAAAGLTAVFFGAKQTITDGYHVASRRRSAAAAAATDDAMAA